MPEETPQFSEEQVEKATSLLDIRKIIGGLLGVYGLLLLGAGLFASEADKEKAAGVNINLWVSFALLLAAALFMVWGFTRPLVDELGTRTRDYRTEPGAPARHDAPWAAARRRERARTTRRSRRQMRAPSSPPLAAPPLLHLSPRPRRSSRSSRARRRAGSEAGRVARARDRASTR